MLPDLNDEGEVPPGVYRTTWPEFHSRFCISSPRRVWLSGRLQTALELATSSGKLHRIFVWGSFITGKAAPKDIDLLLVMAEDFEVDAMDAAVRVVFDSARARLMFESDIFWARASIGTEMLSLWLDTRQTSRNYRRRGIVELELT